MSPRGLFITGTSTGVGKTYVACLIARTLAAEGRRVGVYKPIASGCLRSGGELISPDAISLWEAAGRPGQRDRVCPQQFEAPLAPHRAARAEGKQVDRELLFRGIEFWHDFAEIVLIEGAGGLLSPVDEDLYNADLASEFGYPLIVVSANALGVINQTLQTLVTAATFRDGLEVAGVVLNDVGPPGDDVSRDSNLGELKARCVPPVLAHVKWQGEDSESNVDWKKIAGEKVDTSN